MAVRSEAGVEWVRSLSLAIEITSHSKEKHLVAEQDLTKLRDRIIHLEGQVAFLYKHLGVTFVPEAAAGDDPGIIEHLKNGNFLEAIKIHRGNTGASYEEGKKAVEEMKGRLGI